MAGPSARVSTPAGPATSRRPRPQGVHRINAGVGMSHEPKARVARDRQGRWAEALEDRRLFSGGALDPSFSVDGKAATNFVAHAVEVQADGKTVVVGDNGSVGPGADFFVARFNVDGTPDTTFGPAHNGTVVTHVGNADKGSGANAVAIQPDGRIVVAGIANHLADSGDFAVARFL